MATKVTTVYAPSKHEVISVSFKFSDQALKTMDKKIKEGMFAMGMDMARLARRNAPVKSSALRNSIRVETDGNIVYVKAGGFINGHHIAYALRREYENNLHPEKKFYMKRAQEEIMREGFMTKYFKGVTQ